MRPVLSVTSECVPLVKTGGLADVAGALPGALAPEGWGLRTLLPGYPAVMKALPEAEPVLAISDLYGGAATVRFGTLNGLEIYVLDAPHLYARDGSLYLDAKGHDFADNDIRFAALGRVAAEIARGAIADWTPELLHCHDWQAGLAPYFLKSWGVNVPSILTIHNIAFQGVTPADRMGHLGLNPSEFNSDGFEYWGQISTLKAGIVYADRITTVSPTYARELTTPDFGMGMDGLLRSRANVLSGILNGIDTGVWNPGTDPEIAAYKGPKGKAKAKKALRKEFGLEKSDGPLAVVISRLSHQKGLDLLLDALPAYLDGGGQLALLGSGDPGLEAAFHDVASHPNVSVKIGYDEALSHRMMAGGDAVLVPSRFEPCGLTQLMGLRYGTLPVVAMTGGLVDTVINASPMARRAGVATGIQFSPITAAALGDALGLLLELYADGEAWAKMQKNAMRQDVGWDAAAAEYAALYQEVATKA